MSSPRGNGRISLLSWNNSLVMITRVGAKRSFHSPLASAQAKLSHGIERASRLESKAFTRLRRASYFLLLVQEKVTKEKHALGIALFGLLPEKCASARLCSAECTSVCTQRNRRDPSRRRFAHRGRCRRNAKGNQKQRASCAQPQRRSPWMDGLRNALGVVRGAEHRRLRRKRPAGARARCARVGCQHTDVLSDDPAEAEKRREF